MFHTCIQPSSNTNQKEPKMQSIITKFYGPTATQGRRFKASMHYGNETVTIGAEPSNTVEMREAHCKAARLLVEKLRKDSPNGWFGEWVSAPLTEDSRVWVCTRGLDAGVEYFATPKN